MLYFLYSNKKRGIALIELIVVIGILAILVGISATAFLFLRKKTDLDSSTQEIINMLRIAREKTIASEQASQYGVYFDDTISPHQYILFKGENFSLRDGSFDEVHKLPQNTEIYEMNLDGGGEIVFHRISGEAIPAGNIKIRLISDPSQTTTIYIGNSGQIDLVSPSSPSTVGLIKDSRHAHFNLGWNMQNAVTLKFYFPDIPQTETVNMADYFDAGKTEFNWSGNFSIGGQEQTFKVHTHLLDPVTWPYTRLCIHRDRNNGKNNQEVIIYIVDEGEDKEIVHYLDDANASAVQGTHTESIELQ